MSTVRLTEAACPRELNTANVTLKTVPWSAVVSTPQPCKKQPLLSKRRYSDHAQGWGHR